MLIPVKICSKYRAERLGLTSANVLGQQTAFFGTAINNVSNYDNSVYQLLCLVDR